MAARAHGRILFWEGGSLWLLSAPPGLPYPKTDPHEHHAIQITVALTGRVDFDVDGGSAVSVSAPKGPPRILRPSSRRPAATLRSEGPRPAVAESVGGEAVAIAPDVTHTFVGSGLVAHLFVAPDGQEGRELVRALFAHARIVTLPLGALGDLPARLRTTFEDPRHDDDDLRALGRAVVVQLIGGDRRQTVRDPRIEKLIVWLGTRLDEDVSLDEVAAFVRLSPGRARHLFVAETGLPLRTFVLWQRLTRALEAFAGGASLTEAAHDAGFADSAHLSRTFRRMFGIAAATLHLR